MWYLLESVAIFRIYAILTEFVHQQCSQCKRGTEPVNQSAIHCQRQLRNEEKATNAGRSNLSLNPQLFLKPSHESRCFLGECLAYDPTTER